MSAFAVFVLLGLIVVVHSALISVFALKRLGCTRAFSQPAVFEGETAEMIEVVRNQSPMLVPWLRVESKISPHLRLGRQENLDVLGQDHYCSLFTLMPYQQIRRRHQVYFARRGAYDLGNAALTAGDALGFSQHTREQAMSVPVLVYPRLLADNELPAPLSRLTGELSVRRHLLTDPFLVRGIRPYQPGDPVRDIHWPATARTGEAQVRLHDYTAQARLMVLINAQRRADQWGEIMMDYEEGDIERAISVAATLCIRALRAGLPAGYAANMPQGREGPSTILTPACGTAREEELLASFARLTIRRTQSFPAFMDALPPLGGADVVILSCYDSEEIRQSAAALRRRGCSVTLHLLTGGEVKAGA